MNRAIMTATFLLMATVPSPAASATSMNCEMLDSLSIKDDYAAIAEKLRQPGTTDEELVESYRAQAMECRGTLQDGFFGPDYSDLLESELQNNLLPGLANYLASLREELEEERRDDAEQQRLTEQMGYCPTLYSMYQEIEKLPGWQNRNLEFIEVYFEQIAGKALSEIDDADVVGLTTKVRECEDTAFDAEMPEAKVRFSYLHDLIRKQREQHAKEEQDVTALIESLPPGCQRATEVLQAFEKNKISNEERSREFSMAVATSDRKRICDVIGSFEDEITKFTTHLKTCQGENSKVAEILMMQGLPLIQMSDHLEQTSAKFDCNWSILNPFR